jgi:hypothetical protein
MKNWLLFLAGFAVAVGLVGVLLVTCWVRDIGDDRKLTIIANARSSQAEGTEAVVTVHN